MHCHLCGGELMLLMERNREREQLRQATANASARFGWAAPEALDRLRFHRAIDQRGEKTMPKRLKFNLLCQVVEEDEAETTIGESELVGEIIIEDKAWPEAIEGRQQSVVWGMEKFLTDVIDLIPQESEKVARGEIRPRA